MVVAKLTTPFINIKAKKLTEKLKASITNQYVTVSNSQIRTEVKKTINTSIGERRDSRPSRKRRVILSVFSRIRAGTRRSISHVTSRSVGAGNMAATRNTASAPKKATLPQMATSRMPNLKTIIWMETLVSRVNSARLTKTKASITMPSNTRSTVMVATEAEMGTPSLRLRITAL